MSAEQGPSVMSSKALGGLAGSRMAAAMALSFGIHAGAAVWFSAPGPPDRGGLPTPVDVHLVRAAPRSVLAPVRAVTPALAPQAPPVAMASAQATPQKPAVSALPVSAVKLPDSAPRARFTVEAAPPERRTPLAPSPTPSRATASISDQRAQRAAVRPREPVRASTPAERTSTERKPAEQAPRPGGQGGAAGMAANAPPREPPRPAAGNPRPEYPMLARRRGLQGRVLVRLEVGPDGTPSAVRVVDSSGVPSLDRAARDAVARWRFLPARRGGQAEAATLDVPVEFRLAPRG